MGPVDQQKRELCKQAYLLIHKYLAAAGKEGQETFEFRKNLRRKDALDIDLNTNKEVMSELNKFKEQGGAAALAAQAASMGGYGAASGVKAARSKGAGAMAAGGASGLPPLGPAAGGVAKAGAKPSKSNPKGGRADAPPLSSIPPRIGCRINRWWPNEHKWYTAVATDYNAEKNEYRLTYNLGSAQETYEDLDLDLADHASYEITGEKVNLLAQKGSAAVNNSAVLQPYLSRGGSGGGSRASKKRKSDDDYDSDEDY